MRAMETRCFHATSALRMFLFFHRWRDLPSRRFQEFFCTIMSNHAAKAFPMCLFCMRRLHFARSPARLRDSSTRQHHMPNALASFMFRIRRITRETFPVCSFASSVNAIHCDIAFAREPFCSLPKVLRPTWCACLELVTIDTQAFQAAASWPLESFCKARVSTARRFRACAQAASQPEKARVTAFLSSLFKHRRILRFLSRVSSVNRRHVSQAADI